ncbi:HAD-IIIC family phosphatase [Streptomyces capillispiralis]|uniref:HAD superfamily phosphatase (TIGR01681 family)/FkbH-like protein n=1 Tax=Streptomyces capillispiralis TaxID=68182 RepID=A0A561SGP2_9ACTN|nr:HAD-IIIC family phosphatase [Streptomyces capillispiralis]TWF74003.1 HAD superfamily phosphatase (TIGR01681 family)/FkbH-like protein [Streptomyces capillispiralis]GHH96307.1 HAD-superfamily phosphatase, subfamily IIIC:FkbH [Streptomyces capillispiralis]
MPDSPGRTTGDVITVAATFTVEPLLPLLRDALEHIGAPHLVEAAPYGQLAEQLLSPSSHFARNTGGLNVGLIRTADWAGGTTDGADGAASQAGQEAGQADVFVAAAQEFAATHGTPTVLVVCPGPTGPARTEPAASRLLTGLAGVPGLAVIDAEEWFSPYDGLDVHDAESADIAHIPYTEEAFAALAIGLTRVVHSVLARPRKVIAVDCDDTLWGGACGDREPADLEITPRFLAVQRFLRRKHDEGFVLALCSRNDPDSVERVFAERAADLELTRRHFVAARINWKPKSRNIVSLAEELRLGVDSFVLVDDNPYVCAEVTESLPDVTVLHMDPGTDPDAVLGDCWELDRFFSTAEDRTRNDGYRADALRREAAAGLADTSRLNERLGTVVVARRAAPAELPRITQLLSRTNQFTSATVESGDVPALLARGAAGAWTATLRDRFGDYGTIATAVTTRGDDGEVRVESFAMSCRALERGVTEALFAEIAEDGDVDELHVRFRRTGRNGPALDFLRTHGRDASAHAVDAAATDDTPTEQVYVVPAAALSLSLTEGGTS